MMGAGKKAAQQPQASRKKNAKPKSNAAKGKQVNPAEKNKTHPISKKPSFFQPFQNIPGRIYGWLPPIPFIDKSTSALIYLSMAFYLLFTAYILLNTPQIQMQTEFSEDQLPKNTQLAFLPGESYDYLVIGPDGSASLGYRTYASSSCQGMVLEETSSQVKVCLLKNGFEQGAPLEEQFNSGVGNGTFIIFSPWMLAVSNDFEWRAHQKITAASVQSTVSTVYHSLGSRQIAGRDAFEIALSTAIDAVQSPEDADAPRLFIDSQKRVLLLAQAGNVSVKLVSAPFPLNWTGQN